MANLTDHTYNDLLVDNQLTIAKVLAMVVLGLGSFFLGLAPLKMTKWWRKKSFSPSIDGNHHHHHHHHHHQQQHHHSHPGDSASESPTVSRLLCFGGGVLLSTTLLHLQPEVREVVSRLQHAELLPETENLGDLLFCAGFFMVFIVDELAHTVLDWFYASGRRAHCADENVLRQSMSLDQRSRSVSSQFEPASLSGCNDQENEAQKEESSSRDRQERYRQHHHDNPFSMQLQSSDHNVEKQQQLQVGLETGSCENDDHSLRGLFTVLALSFHEIFEGMAIGLEERLDHVWYLFLAVATHKLVIAFCIGLELAWSGTRRFMLIVYVATFAVVTPIGIAFGMAIMHFGGTVDSKHGSPGPVAAVLQGLAAGTLLYVVFFEVLARHKQSGCSHLLFIMFGFGVLLVLQMLSEYLQKSDNFFIIMTVRETNEKIDH